MDALSQKSSDEAIGTAIVDFSLLDTLARLWEGPLYPTDLAKVELAVRAFLVSNRLSVSKIRDPMHSNRYGRLDVYDEPFQDHLLDYEFIIHPPLADPKEILSTDETDSLAQLVRSSITRQANGILPEWIRYESEAFAFLDAWYAGNPLAICEQAASNPCEWEDPDQPRRTLDRKSFFQEGRHEQFHLGLDIDANYLVACHRVGYTVYSNTPVGEACNKHIFSEWPAKLFGTFEEDFKRVARSLRGPGLAFDLPPLTALVLSRSRTRHDIRLVLRDLRDEYKTPRRKLWGTLLHMWRAESLREQIVVLRELEDAASSIFDVAFPQRFNALSLSLSVAPLSRDAIVNAGLNLLELDRPNARVSAISFAAKLAKDLRKNLLNTRELLRRHLDDSERNAFGM